MQTLRVFQIGLVAVVAGLVWGQSASASQAPTRAVFELFTSQGCSSCPPGDKLLSNYAHEDKSVIALTYPVTIWDHLGWRDTLARPENTQRQRAYMSLRGDGKLYTPQMVINGVAHAVGSDKGEIEKQCRVTAEGQAMRVPMSAQADHGAVDISIERWPERTESPRARVYLVSYARETKVPIGSGENAGKTTSYSNVVQSVQEVAYWNGQKLSLRLFWKPSEAQGGALILQGMSNSGPGAIYGAVQLP
ncbi:MAG: DUF1223 domain-containing protein [Pseudomonadota bacterium]